MNGVETYSCHTEKIKLDTPEKTPGGSEMQK